MNEAGDSKFLTRNWNIVNDQSNANYSVGNEIIYSTEVLKSNVCDYTYAYILASDDISIIGHNLATKVAFKNCVPFINCITKIDGATMNDTDEKIQKIWLCRCIITARITQTRQVLCGFILKRKQLILC